ncbi:OLC1v1010512C3 [Oldenlandia corymbosa var. corymbosa]|uniref:OLC1v1010512C3 n=1 Tax=Oldenlandia corymbosa var. corymbosa TaxID=529605 RepID=A0AAV1DT68_OLDCO|nr:OLC1v1010512C3 [Oldenlandia corymbosa var. corymbosa]
METNTSDVNHLDADVLLPPRKRLLAGLKRQNSDVNPRTPTSSSNSGTDFDARYSNFMKSHPNLSYEEIVESSRSAAADAAKVAQAARATAEEKATKAAKAVAAAKIAIELVAAVEEIANGDKYLKKNKMKKQVEVQTLYDKAKGTQVPKTDEELARKLHQAINSSPRISKTASESKHHKHKKLKSASSFEKASVNYVGTDLQGHQSSSSNSNGIAGGMARDGSAQAAAYVEKVDLNLPKFSRPDGQKLESGERLKLNESDNLIKENGEADSDRLGEKIGEDDDSGLSKKKMRIKQKKLPLSICSIKDLGTPKEDPRTLLVTDNERKKINGTGKSMYSVGPPGETGVPVERTAMWKCQAFKAPACVKQNKVMQS